MLLSIIGNMIIFSGKVPEFHFLVVHRISHEMTLNEQMVMIRIRRI